MRSAFAACGVEQPAILAKFDGLDQVDAFDSSWMNSPSSSNPSISPAASMSASAAMPAAQAGPLALLRARAVLLGPSFVGQALVEEPVFGPEYSAECVVREGDFFISSPRRSSSAPPRLRRGRPPERGAARAGDRGADRACRIGHRPAWNLPVRGPARRIRDLGRAREGRRGRLPDRWRHDLRAGRARHGVSLEECLVLLRAGKDPAPVLPAPEPAAPAVSSHQVPVC